MNRKIRKRIRSLPSATVAVRWHRIAWEATAVQMGVSLPREALRKPRRKSVA